MAFSNHEMQALRQACDDLPDGPDYRCGDYDENLMLTVLDFFQKVEPVNRAIGHFRAKHGFERGSELGDFIAKFSDTEAGNRALAQALWGYNYWTRASFLRTLMSEFQNRGIKDQATLVAWLKASDFDQDISGKFKAAGHSIGIAIYNWLLLRCGFPTVKPDRHVLNFVSRAIGRRVSASEALYALRSIASESKRESYRLDSAIWHSERQDMEPEDYQYCLDCFLGTDPGDEAEPDHQIGAGTVDDLIDQAEKLIRGGRFKHLELYRWDASADEWVELQTWP